MPDEVHDHPYSFMTLINEIPCTLGMHISDGSILKTDVKWEKSPKSRMRG